MPIDPNIPLAVKPVQIDSPLQTMGNLYKVQREGVNLDQDRLENERKRIDNAKLTREAADEAAIRTELSNAKTGPDGQLDVPGAIQNLHKNGFGTAGMKLTKEWTDHLQKQAATAKSQIEGHTADLDLGARLWAGVKDDASLAAAKKAAPAVMGPDSAKLLDGLPDDYASAKPQIDALLEAGNKMGDKLRAAHEAVTEHQYALEHGLVAPDPAKGETQPPAVAEQREKVDALQTSSVGKMLMHASNDAEYQSQLAAFKQQGYPASVLNKFDTVWSPKAVAKAKSLTMTPKEAEELRIQGQNANTASAREKREASAPGKDDPTFTHDMEEYKAELSRYNRTQPREGDIDTNAPAGQETQHYKAPASFTDWRKSGKGSLVAAPPPATPPQGRGAPPISLAPPQPPPAAAAPPVPAAPATQLPTTPPAAPAAPAAAGGQGFILTVNQAGKPPRHFKFKSEADRDKFAKDAGLQLQPAK